MARDSIHVGGTPVLRYTINDGDQTIADAYNPLQDATLIELRLVAPTGGTTATVSPVIPSGEDSVIEYQALVGTFDVAGEWSVQAKIEFSSGLVRFFSDLDTFTVHDVQFP